MKRTVVNLSVSESVDCLKESLEAKGFTIFCDIDHHANAKGANLDMPASRVLIFGNPVAGTKLMQKDITMSLDLPLRLAIVDNNGQTLLIHQSSEDYCKYYQVEDHPVLENVETLFTTLVSEIQANS